MFATGLLQSTLAGANDGRSVKRRSPFVSWPVTILKGAPELARMKGFKLICHQGRLSVPANVNRWRTSKAARPNSPDISYELAGNSEPPCPSVSLVVLLSA